MVAVISLVLFCIFAAVAGENSCNKVYVEYGGIFYDGKPKYATLTLHAGEPYASVLLHEYQPLYLQPDLTSIKAYLCVNDVDLEYLTLTYVNKGLNGYLVAETNYYTYKDVELYIEYIEMPAPYEPLRNGTVLRGYYKV